MQAGKNADRQKCRRAGRQGRQHAQLNDVTYNIKNNVLSPIYVFPLAASTRRRVDASTVEATSTDGDRRIGGSWLERDPPRLSTVSSPSLNGFFPYES